MLCHTLALILRIAYSPPPLLGLVAQSLASGVAQAHCGLLQEKKLLQNIRPYQSERAGDWSHLTMQYTDIHTVSPANIKSSLHRQY